MRRTSSGVVVVVTSMSDFAARCALAKAWRFLLSSALAFPGPFCLHFLSPPSNVICLSRIRPAMAEEPPPLSPGSRAPPLPPLRSRGSPWRFRDPPEPPPRKTRPSEPISLSSSNNSGAWSPGPNDSPVGRLKNRPSNRPSSSPSNSPSAGAGALAVTLRATDPQSGILQAAYSPLQAAAGRAAVRRAAELTIALSVVLRDSRALRAERTRRGDTDTRERAERAEREEREERAGDEQGRRLGELGLLFAGTLTSE